MRQLDTIAPGAVDRRILWRDLQRLHDEADSEFSGAGSVREIVRHCRAVRLTLAVAGELDRFLEDIDAQEQERIQRERAFYSTPIKQGGNDD